MPSGRIHSSATTGLIIGAVSMESVLITAGIASPDHLPIYLASGLGMAATYWVNPDNDLHNKLGPLGKLLGFDHYRDTVPHRGGMRLSHWRKAKSLVAMSHIPFLGTLPRTLLLIAPVLALFLIFGAADVFPIRLAIWFWIGMGVSDCLHWLMDGIASGLKADRKIYLAGRKRKKSEYKRRGKWKVLD